MSEQRDLVPAEGGKLSRRLEALGSARRSRAPVPQRSEPPAPSAEAPLPAPRTRRFAGRGDAQFHPANLAIEETPRSPIHKWVVIAILALLATALAWSYFGRLASYTQATGKIQTAGRTKVLEALTTGKVIKILFRDGDIVQAGAVLAVLDPTDAQASRDIINLQLTDLKAETLRRKTEIEAARVDRIDPKTKIPWGKDVPASVKRREDGVARADLSNLASQIATLVSQKHEKEAERDKYSKNITAQKALVAVTQENMTMIDGLTKKGYNSQAKFLDTKAQLDGQQVTLTGFEGSLENAKQSILTIESQIAKTREVFVTTNTQTIATNEQTIVDLTQKLVKADQILSNMTLRSPATGVVHASAVTTIGQVVKPGQQLMQIVPRDATLEIQTYVSNTDIGFIRVGDPATIKVTTFAFGTYGSVDGKVTDISNDSLAQGHDSIQSASLDGEYSSTTTAQKTGNLQYPVLVRTDRSTMLIDGKEVALAPGMQVTVEIMTEQRRAIDYIVSPLLELFSTAGHEK